MMAGMAGYVDSTGHHQELSGKWIINDQETTSGQMEVSPVEPLMVDFQSDDHEEYRGPSLSM